jgi:hypothetical protein
MILQAEHLKHTTGLHGARKDGHWIVVLFQGRVVLFDSCACLKSNKITQQLHLTHSGVVQAS